MDHYATLGIPRTATDDQIRRAYRELAKRLHPDIDPSPRAAERFIAVHKAYTDLRDPLLRLAHDAQLARSTHRAAPRTRPMPQRPETEERDIDRRSWAFIGLHLTGLVFGLVLVLGILTGITFSDWPWGAVFFTVPGLLVIPDAWEGLAMVRRSNDQKIR